MVGSSRRAHIRSALSCNQMWSSVSLTRHGAHQRTSFLLIGILLRRFLMWEKDLSKSLIGIYYGAQVCYDFEFCDG
jgi:hypothetical protein